MNTAFLGLGANLEAPIEQLQGAIRRLDADVDIQVVKVSAMYRTPPVGGPPNQPDYINAVAEVSTVKTAHDLLAELQRVENEFHRKREVRWGARTLDLDLLLFNRDTFSDVPKLIVPHPRLHERAFVLVPLAEIAASYEVPGQGLVRSLLARLAASDVSSISKQQEFWS